MAGQHRTAGQYPMAGHPPRLAGPPATAAPHPLAEQPSRPGCLLRTVRGFSGVLAGGLVVLAVAVGVAQWLVGSSGRPGPGTDVVVWHAVAALAAVTFQVIADRVRGLRLLLAAGAVLLLTAAVLWFGWYA